VRTLFEHPPPVMGLGGPSGITSRRSPVSRPRPWWSSRHRVAVCSSSNGTAAGVHISKLRVVRQRNFKNSAFVYTYPHALTLPALAATMVPGPRLVVAAPVLTDGADRGMVGDVVASDDLPSAGDGWCPRTSSGARCRNREHHRAITRVGRRVSPPADRSRTPTELGAGGAADGGEARGESRRGRLGGAI
jgi:hypothetical protein